MDSIVDILVIFGSNETYNKIKLLTNNALINVRHQTSLGNISSLQVLSKYRIIILCLDEKNTFTVYYPMLYKLFPSSYIVILSNITGTQEIASYVRSGAYTVVSYGNIEEIDGVVKNLVEQIIHEKSVDYNFNINPIVFKNLLEQVEHIAVQGYNVKGDIVYWNKGSHNLYGYSSEEVKGKKVSDLIMPPHLRNVVIDEIAGIIEKQIIPPARTITLKHKDGSKIVVMSYYTIIENYRGEKEIFFIDIDQTFQVDVQRGIETEKAYFKSLFESVPLAIAVLDNNDRLMDCNIHFEMLFGYSKNESIGKQINDLIVPNNLKDEGEMITRKVINGQTTYNETVRKTESGNLIEVSIIGKPVIISEKQIAVLGIYQDIAIRKEFERALTSEKVKAESSDNLKTLFLKNISHEVRTPLNGIMGFASLLINPELSDNVRKEYFGLLQQSCDRLLKTITNYIDASLLMSNNVIPRITEVALSGLIFDIYKDYYEKIDSKKIIFSMNLPENSDIFSINTDHELLKKILGHLLDNAIKYTSEGLITIGFTIDSDYLKIFVEDTGIGIPYQELAKLFRAFSRIDDPKTPYYDGSGLSLSISKNIIGLINGNILVDSIQAKGTRFDIVFERKYIVEIGSSIKENPTENKSMEHNTILIVDDDQISRILLERIIANKTNLKIYTAKNGKEAVQLYFEKQDISIIFMDIKMPVLNGYEASQQIRQINNKATIIAVTAFVAEHENNPVHNNLFNGYITKPYSTEQIIAVLKKFDVSV